MHIIFLLIFSFVPGIILLAVGECIQPPVENCSLVRFYSVDCDYHVANNCNSLSLNEIANDLEVNSTVSIDINTSLLQLNETVEFSELLELRIIGSPQMNTTVICTEPHSGIVMHSIVSLVMNNVTVSQCGATVHTMHGTVYNSAISILQCMDIELSHLILERNAGIGLAILDHHGGWVNIKSSQFLENVPECTHNNVSTGGGIFIGGYEHDPSFPSIFRLENCTFSKNVALNEHFKHRYINDVGQTISGHGFGGGAAVALDKGLTDVHVVFINCTFCKNEAFVGGGLASIIGAPNAKTRNVSLRVIDSMFENNGNKNATQGGGMYIQFDDSNEIFDSSEFVVHGVNFTGNSAEFGGGLKLLLLSERSEILMNKIEIKDCNFSSNVAHAGSALDITSTISQSLANGFPIIPVITNCTFSKNTVNPNEYNNTHATFGIGTLYVSLHSIKLEGFNRFESNLGTAIYIVNGNINMSQSSVNFFGNQGIQGGAIALIGDSLMIFGQNRIYKFANNTALDKGGAVYAQVLNIQNAIALNKCFLQCHNAVSNGRWNVVISFIGNRAATGFGHAIFAGTFFPCQIDDKLNNLWEVFHEWGVLVERNLSMQGLQIATEGSSLYSKDNPLNVIPGERFAHGVIVEDDFHQRASETLTTVSWNDAYTHTPDNTSRVLCIEEFVTVKGRPHEQIKLYLQTVTLRLSYTQLNIVLADCPVGFFYNYSSSKCDCNDREYPGIVKCERSNLRSYLSSGYWAGYVDNNATGDRVLVTSYCPLNFCTYNHSRKQGSLIRLPKTYARLEESVCGKSRTGIACGECASGYTSHYHSPNYVCKPAEPAAYKLGWLFYFLSELIPVTVVFITVLVLNVNFTCGGVNGFILFSQILNTLDVDASGMITFPPLIGVLMDGYQLLYGPFSFNFFHIEPLSFSLWPNATALDMVAFKYVSILYALLLVILVIWFMNKCATRFSRKATIKSSIIHGLSAFLILCYSQCVRISLTLLNSFPLYIRNGTTSRRVWLNGNIVSFSANHLPYALPALFCLLTIGLMPPFLLLAYPLANKVLAIVHCEDLKLSKYITIVRLKPLLDAFQGCFKDNLRFFAGLYFLYRWTTLIIGILPSIGYGRAYIIKGCLLTLFLALHAVCQPYTVKTYNVIDSLLFADLVLLNAIIFFHYHTFNASARKTQDIAITAVIQLILIYLPFIVMIVYVIVKTCRLGYRQCCSTKDQNTDIKPISLNSFISLFGRRNRPEMEELPYRLLADDEENTATL
jgi:predicted outer membrane repeat protein